jgi:Na+-translocating ferredoxin:NAD+ oxidoreductase RnfE subunit
MWAWIPADARIPILVFVVAMLVLAALAWFGYDAWTTDP